MSVRLAGSGTVAGTSLPWTERGQGRIDVGRSPRRWRGGFANCASFNAAAIVRPAPVTGEPLPFTHPSVVELAGALSTGSSTRRQRHAPKQHRRRRPEYRKATALCPNFAAGRRARPDRLHQPRPALVDVRIVRPDQRADDDIRKRAGLRPTDRHVMIVGPTNSECPVSTNTIGTAYASRRGSDQRRDCWRWLRCAHEAILVRNNLARRLDFEGQGHRAHASPYDLDPLRRRPRKPTCPAESLTSASSLNMNVAGPWASVSFCNATARLLVASPTVIPSIGSLRTSTTFTTTSARESSAPAPHAG